MLGFILIPVFIVMLCVIGFREDWKKALKILGIWFASVFLMAIIETLFGITAKSPAFNILAFIWWGAWDTGLLIYNIKEGCIYFK